MAFFVSLLWEKVTKASFKLAFIFLSPWCTYKWISGAGTKYFQVPRIQSSRISRQKIKISVRWIEKKIRTQGIVWWGTIKHLPENKKVLSAISHRRSRPPMNQINTDCLAGIMKAQRISWSSCMLEHQLNKDYLLKTCLDTIVEGHRLAPNQQELATSPLYAGKEKIALVLPWMS